MKSLKNFTKNFFKKEVVSFLSYLKEVRGYSLATITTYGIVLEKIEPYLDIEIKKSVTVLNIIAYRSHISTQNRKTISKKISVIRSFNAYLQDKGYSTKLKGDDSIKTPKTLPKPLEKAYIYEALNIANPQEKLLVLCIYGLGLRISEVSNLKLEDFTSKWVNVVGKGSKTRTLPLLEELSDELDIYKNSYTPKLYIFEDDGERLSENRLRYKIKKLFSKIGIKATPHQLRHSYATDILNSGGRITDVSKLLGHSSLSTTEIYTKLNSGIKMQNYLHSHPLCRRDDGN